VGVRHGRTRRWELSKGILQHNSGVKAIIGIFVLLGMLAFGGAPSIFLVKVETSAGDFVVEVHREWAPIGAARDRLVRATVKK
jgi:hypothetical protein